MCVCVCVCKKYSTVKYSTNEFEFVDFIFVFLGWNGKSLSSVLRRNNKYRTEILKNVVYKLMISQRVMPVSQEGIQFWQVKHVAIRLGI